MPTHEILGDQWAEFFQTFTSEHSGWLATIGVEAHHSHHSKTVAIEGRELPLRDIAADLKDKEKTVVITVGGRGDELLTHEVRAVSHVRLTEDENGQESTLHFEAADGGTTTVTVSAIPKP